ncbi:protein REGULATOR OF FATTY ACID COMPOSITION 3, chloroplastic-like [Primulina huaijiensis]|uniref:protein REGULATOR OF FATTY ACID COMPOSITION 3, chloroplastic-like n=1 Tax=Primulina huaijiensis TaxID=1492673 RepID=UPI003CC770DE
MALNPPQFALSGKNSIWAPADGRKHSSTSCFFPFFSQGLRLRGHSTTVAAAKKENKNINKRKKDDGHSFASNPDEATGPFPEAVLLKERKVEEDGRLMPEFADVEERELFEFLNLELESDTGVGQMRHYEVVYLIHEKHEEEVENVNLKVQEFLKEKKGRVWRFSDWGMRKLAYKIQKAKSAHYILMNFELEAQLINDFKSMLDRDERIIRHLVMKRDKAETEDCPPPPEFQSLGSDMNDDEDDIDYDDQDFDDDEEVIIYVDDEDDSRETSGGFGMNNQKPQRVG